MKKTRSKKKIICFLFAKSIFYSIFAVTKKEYWNMKNLETRTSIRKYAQREVSNQLLHRLLSQAERTQTMGNLQLYSVVITRSEAQKAALREMMSTYMKENSVQPKNGTDVNSIMRDMMSIILE